VLYFPQNSRGAMAQKQHQATASFETVKNALPTGRRFTYARRPTPLSAFTLGMSSISSGDRAIYEAFFATVDGRLRSFTYLDPNGNLVPASEDFSASSWTLAGVSAGSAVTDPFGGTCAMSMASTGSDGIMYAPVLPSGGAIGFWLCASVWAKAPASGTKLAIGFRSSSGANLGRASFDCPANDWTRIRYAVQLVMSDPVYVQIGGDSTWASRTINLFGAQVSPMRGPGAYAKTPGNLGMVTNCRFGTDSLEFRNIGNNEWSVDIQIQQKGP
jgi:hypothetical protein